MAQSTNKKKAVTKYLDDYRSPSDCKALREEGYEVDYTRLIGVGLRSAVFLGHPLNVAKPALDHGAKPIYTPGYDLAVKVIARYHLKGKGAAKARTRNLKLALALGQANQEHILKVIEVFKTPDRIFIFMQYCIYGNCVNFIRRHGRVTEEYAQKWARQMALALEFLHKFHVAHRNYKLENVLIDDQLNAKLTGFGFSKFCIDMNTKQLVMSRTICGSEPYLAPEMLKDSNERNYDPKQADVWAFGVGVYLSLTRRYPFEAENLRALKQEQLAKRYLEKDRHKRLSTGARDLLNATFEIDPNNRPSMRDLCVYSPWLAAPPTAPITPTTPTGGVYPEASDDSKSVIQSSVGGAQNIQSSMSKHTQMSRSSPR